MNDSFPWRNLRFYEYYQHIKSNSAGNQPGSMTDPRHGRPLRHETDRNHHAFPVGLRLGFVRFLCTSSFRHSILADDVGELVGGFTKLTFVQPGDMAVDEEAVGLPGVAKHHPPR